MPNPKLPRNPNTARPSVRYQPAASPVSTGQGSRQGLSYLDGTESRTASARLQNDVINLCNELRNAGPKDIHGISYISNLTNACRANDHSHLRFLMTMDSVQHIWSRHQDVTDALFSSSSELVKLVKGLIFHEISGNAQGPAYGGLVPHATMTYTAPPATSNTYTPPLGQGPFSGASSSSSPLFHLSGSEQGSSPRGPRRR